MAGWRRQERSPHRHSELAGRRPAHAGCQRTRQARLLASDRPGRPGCKQTPAVASVWQNVTGVAAGMPNAPGLPPAGGGLRRIRRPDLSRRPRRHWPGSAASAPWAPDPGTGCRYAARSPSPCTRGWQDRPSPGHRRACRSWSPGQTHAPGRVEDHPGLGGYAGQQREDVGRQRVKAGRAMLGVCAVPVPAERGRPRGEVSGHPEPFGVLGPAGPCPRCPRRLQRRGECPGEPGLGDDRAMASGSKVTTMPAPYFRPPSCTAAARAVLVTAPAPAILAASSTGTIVSRMTIDTTALTSGNFWPSRS
jgi:hypothetical protein